MSSNKRNGNFEEALRPYSTFHNWGLGTEEESKRNPSIKTIQQTMAELGHTGKTIDIFVSTILLPLQGWAFNINASIPSQPVWSSLICIWLFARKLTVNGVNGSHLRIGWKWIWDRYWLRHTTRRCQIPVWVSCVDNAVTDYRLVPDLILLHLLGLLLQIAW